MVCRPSPTQLNMQLIKQMCALLPQRRFDLTIQSHRGFPSIYSNCEAIRGSRCVLGAADVTCGHRRRRDSHYHDNTNYTGGSRAERLHSWAAFGVAAHHSQVHLTRFPRRRARGKVRTRRRENRQTLPGQTQLQASGGVFVVLGFRTARSPVSSFVTSQPAASREKTTKSMKRVHACVPASSSVCLCVCVYIGFNWALLLTAPPHSHTLSFFPYRSQRASEVIFGHFLPSQRRLFLPLPLVHCFSQPPNPKAPPLPLKMSHNGFTLIG